MLGNPEHLAAEARAYYLDTAPPDSDLIQLKQVMEAASRAAGVVRRIGKMSDGTSPSVWVGPMSLAARMRSGELTSGDIDIAEEVLRGMYVPVSIDGAERCVDDRTVAGFRSNDARWYARPLGPQVQGATVGVAATKRLHTFGGAVSTRGASPTLADDVCVEAERPDRTYAPGAHTGDGHDCNKLGCAAVDEQSAKLRTFRKPAAVEGIATITDTVLSYYGVKSTVGRLKEGSKALRRTSGYLSSTGNLEAVELVRLLNANGVPHMEGPHGGILLAVNYVKGTTLHTDEFNSVMQQRTDKNINAFGLDAWHIIGEYGTEVGSALVDQAVNTMMQLHDGSLLVFTRTPNQTM